MARKPLEKSEEPTETIPEEEAGKAKPTSVVVAALARAEDSENLVNGQAVQTGGTGPPRERPGAGNPKRMDVLGCKSWKSTSDLPPDCVYLSCPVHGNQHVVLMKKEHHLLLSKLRLGPPDKNGRRAVDPMLEQTDAMHSSPGFPTKKTLTYNSQFQTFRRDVTRCVVISNGYQSKDSMPSTEMPPLYRDRRRAEKFEGDATWGTLSKSEKRKRKMEECRKNHEKCAGVVAALAMNQAALNMLGWTTEDLPQVDNYLPSRPKKRG